jgi:hypothetical protein
MTEPLFIDCLTDTQFWSLFEAGVLNGGMLQAEVYRRLERIAPDHGCYLFAWPAGVDVPSLQEIISGIAVPGEEPPVQTNSDCVGAHVTAESVRSKIEAFCERTNTALPPEGGRIHVISTNPRPELRLGPHLAPQPRDLNAMSLSELEAYLEEVLRLDAAHDVEAAALSASKPPYQAAARPHG